MNIVTKNILMLLESRGISANKMQTELKLANNAVTQWKKGFASPSAKTLQKIADYFNLPISYFYEDHESADKKFQSENILVLPVYATVTAGFDHSISDIDGELQEVPASITNGHNEKDLFVFQVSGDSMFPTLLDGDRVLVVKTPSVDSGDIAVISYHDYEDGTVKKVLYEPNCDYVDLIPTNPKYSPIRLQGEELQGMQVVGKVIYLFRKI